MSGRWYQKRRSKVFVVECKRFSLQGMAALALALAACPLYAQQPNGRAARPAEKQLPQRGLFTRGSVANLFDTKLELLPPQEIVMQRPIVEWGKRPSEQEISARRDEIVKQVEDQMRPDSFAAPVASAQAPAAKSNEASPPAEAAALSPRDKILQAYGDPSQAHPVKAIDNAPAPYRAMYECLRINDEECAFRYAMQYVRYQRDLENTIDRATAIEGKAMMREGLLPRGSWADKPEWRDYDRLMSLKLDGKDADGEGDLRQEDTSKRLDAETRAKLARVKGQQYDLFGNQKTTDPIAKQLNEREERAKARRILQQKVPVDAEGRVDVYCFIRPYQEDTQAIAGDIEKLYQRSLKDKRINFAALLLDRYDTSKIDYYRENTGATYPIKDGMQLGETLGVSKAPTLLFVTQDGRQHTEEGLRNFYYYDELLNLMQGR